MNGHEVNPPPADAPKCPHCGTPLPAGALSGLCPACLLKQGATEETATGGAAQTFVPPTVAELAPSFPQLEVIELIGKGGMGAVYKARQRQLDRIVALKILPPGIGSDPAFAVRFAREAKALAKLNHPNIITIYDFGRADGLFYFFMEFVDGITLRQLLNTGRIAPREALAIVPQICDALQFAHDQGIVHRDIKPENILLDRRGRVKVADFGLAKIVAAVYDRPTSEDDRVRQSQTAATENLTEADKVMGTPNYMAPEQIEHPAEVDHRADIYALGVVFYQMLTGELPAKQIEPPSSKVHIDVRLDEIVLRALEKKPALRYQQASVFKTELETIAETQPSGKRQADAATEDPRSKALRPGVPWQILVVVIMLALEGVGNLATIPKQPQALYWIAMKILFIAGLLKRWRPIFVLFTVVALIHVVYFATISPIASLLNLVMVILVVSAYRFYFSRDTGAMPRETDVARRRRLKTWAALLFAVSIPVIGFAIFFINALIEQHGKWNPAPDEAVIVPLIWLGALLLPVCGWKLWSAATRSDKTPLPNLAPFPFTPAIFFVVLYVALLVILASSADLLPSQVASHFNGDGRPNGWMTRSDYLIFIGAIPLLLAGFFGLLAWLVKTVPGNWVNIPRRDFWLVPERRALTSAIILRRLLWLACLIVCFFGGLHWAIVEAHRQTPPHLSGGSFLFLIIGFLICLIIWVASLLHFFAETERSANKIAVSAPAPLHAVEAWLALMDAGNYAKSWETAAPFFHRSVTREEWIAKLEKIRRPLGNILHRKLVSVTPSAAGMQRVAVYISAFEGLPSATEALTFTKQPNGEWLPIGYLIQPASNAAAIHWLPPTPLSKTFGWLWLVIFTGFLFLLLAEHYSGPLDGSIWKYFSRCFLGFTVVSSIELLVRIRQARANKSPQGARGVKSLWKPALIGAAISLGLVVVFVWLPAYHHIRSENRRGVLQTELREKLATLLADQYRITYSDVSFDFASNAPQVTVHYGGLQSWKDMTNGVPRNLRGDIVLEFNLNLNPLNFWNVRGTGDLSPINTSLQTTNLGFVWWKQRREEQGLATATIKSDYVGQTYFPEGDSIELTSVTRTENVMTVKGYYSLVSHDQASLEVHVTSSNSLGFREVASQSVRIQKGSAGFELVYPHPVFGLPHVNMYPTSGGSAFAELYFGTKEEAEHESRLVLHSEAAHRIGIFGPAIERVLNDPDDDPHNSFLDLDTGKLFDDPVPMPTGNVSAEMRIGFALGSAETLQRTIREHKVDLIGDASGGSLIGCDLAVTPLYAEQFDNVIWNEKFARWLNDSPLTNIVRDSVVLHATNTPATWGFITREGGMGILQITGFTEKPHAVKLRYRLAQNTDAPIVETRRELSFGPVIERVLPDAEARTGYETLDLQSGNFLSRPRQQSDDVVLPWLATNRADLMAAWGPDPEDSNRVYFACIKTRISDFDGERWATATAADCLKALESGTSLQPMDESSMDPDFTDAGGMVYFLPPATQLPRTLAFRNRNGVTGLIQITGFTENPRGVRIRYKLVQRSTPLNNLRARLEAATSIMEVRERSDTLFELVKEAIKANDLELAKEAAKEISVLGMQDQAIREIALALKRSGRLHEAIEMANTLSIVTERDRTLIELGK